MGTGSSLFILAQRGNPGELSVLIAAGKRVYRKAKSDRKRMNEVRFSGKTSSNNPGRWNKNAHAVERKVRME